MNSQHLSDEAVAACADGVLSGHARERATKHVNGCAECRHAVRVQREAAWALRAAPAPALPAELAARLRSVPQTTSIRALPTVVAPDGSTMLATFAPVAAFVGPQPSRTTATTVHRSRPFITTAAVVALAGALAAGSVARATETPAQNGTGHTGTGQVGTGHAGTGHANQPIEIDKPLVVTPISVFRGHRP